MKHPNQKLSRLPSYRIKRTSPTMSVFNKFAIVCVSLRLKPKRTYPAVSWGSEKKVRERTGRATSASHEHREHDALYQIIK